MNHEKWYDAVCVFRILKEKDIIKHNQEIGNPKINERRLNIKLETITGVTCFQIFMPDKIIRRSIAFERFCRMHNIRLSTFDECSYQAS